MDKKSTENITDPTCGVPYDSDEEVNLLLSNCEKVDDARPVGDVGVLQIDLENENMEGAIMERPLNKKALASIQYAKQKKKLTKKVKKGS